VTSWRNLVSLLCAVIAATAHATPAQGYSLTLEPLAHDTTRWLIVAAEEQSDPNTAGADRVLPSMQRTRSWWVLFDSQGRSRCTVARREGDAGTVQAARERLALVCRQSPVVLRQAAAWTTVAATDAQTPARIAWSSERVCAGKRCIGARSMQRTVFDRLQRAPQAGSEPAPALCVAGHWLIVSNWQTPGLADVQEGVSFRGLPPPLPETIVGYEFVRIDGVTVRPRALDCG
jgi:hypothetical protein